MSGGSVTNSYDVIIVNIPAAVKYYIINITIMELLLHLDAESLERPT